MELLPAPGIHADLTATSALATPNEQSAAALIEIAFSQGEHLLNAQPRAPQDPVIDVDQRDRAAART